MEANRFSSSIAQRLIFLDHPVSYRILAILFYLGFLAKIVTGYDAGILSVFPNPLLLVIITIFSFLLTSVANYLERVQMRLLWILSRIVLAIIPPLLGMLIIIRWLRTNRDNSPFLWAGMLSFLLVFAFLTIYTIPLLGLILLYPQVPTLPFYIITSLAIWGMLGISLGDYLQSRWNLKYGKMKVRVEGKRSRVEQKLDEKEQKSRLVNYLQLLQQPRYRLSLAGISILVLLLIYLLDPLLFPAMGYDL